MFLKIHKTNRNYQKHRHHSKYSTNTRKSNLITLYSDKQSNDPVIIITQFYIDNNPKRQLEIMYCLKTNCENRFINKIYLLNERIYTQKELGLTDENMMKIYQIDIGNRLKFKDVFDFVENKNINGFIVFCNADIIISETIEKLLYTNLSTTKSAFALSRYEMDDTKTYNDNNLISYASVSQDTWIIHTNNNIKEKRELFSFYFGKPGCDNYLVYLLVQLGYEVYNNPKIIKTYHYHVSNIRNYNMNERIKASYTYLSYT